MLIAGGRLGDIHGRCRLFVVGVALFTLASAACGLAPNAGLLVTARVGQGVAGALLQPHVPATLGVLYAGAERAKAFAAYGLALGLGAAGGEPIGGVLIHSDLAGLGWRNCFLINVPIGVLALVLSGRALPPIQGLHASRLDLPGMVLVAVALTATVLPLVQGRPKAGQVESCRPGRIAAIPRASRSSRWRGTAGRLRHIQRPLNQTREAIALTMVVP